jgi:MATE family multidrug resistance protein
MSLSTTYFSKDEIIKIPKSLKEIFLTSIPNILNVGFFFLLIAINSGFISAKYSDHNMINAIGTTNLYLNCTTFIILYSMIHTMNTLCSNALGKQNLYLFGLYMHRCRLISFIFLISITIFHKLFAMKLVSLLTDDEEILKYTEEYMYKLLFVISIDFVFRMNISYLTIIDKARISVAIISFTSVLHLLWCHIFINVLDLGVSGAAYSLMLTQTLNFLLSTAYIYYVDPLPGTFFKLNADCFVGWKEYLNLGVPIILSGFSDWMGFEIQAIIALNCGPIHYSVHIVLVQIENLLFTYGFSISVVASMKIAKILVTDHKLCDYYFKVWLGFCMGSEVILFIIMIYFKDAIIGIYSTSQEAREIMEAVWILLCFYIFFEGIRIYFLGSFRGLSFISKPTLYQFISNYVVQVILSILFSIKMKMGVVGIWLAYLICFIALDLIFFYEYYKMDLEKFQLIALERIEHDTNLVANTNKIEMDELNFTKEPDIKYDKINN